MQINSSNLAEVKSHFPAITWRELAYDACASFGLGHGGCTGKLLTVKGTCLKVLLTTTVKRLA